MPPISSALTIRRVDGAGRRRLRIVKPGEQVSVYQLNVNWRERDGFSAVWWGGSHGRPAKCSDDGRAALCASTDAETPQLTRLHQVTSTQLV